MARLGRGQPFPPQIIKGVKYSASPDATVTLTGIAGTGSAGIVVPEIDTGITGVFSTASAGSVTPQIAPAVTGIAATGQAGTPTVRIDASPTLTGIAATGQTTAPKPEIGINPSGQVSTGSAGTVTPQTQPGITGQAGTGLAGSLGLEIDVSVTGISATASKGIVVPEIDVNIAGIAATSQVGTPTVTITGGSDATVTLTGIAATALTTAPTIETDTSFSLHGISLATHAGSVTVSTVLTTAFGGGRGYKDKSGKAIGPTYTYGNAPTVDMGTANKPTPQHPWRKIYHPLISPVPTRQKPVEASKPVTPKIEAEQVKPLNSGPLPLSATLVAVEHLADIERLRRQRAIAKQFRDTEQARVLAAKARSQLELQRRNQVGLHQAELARIEAELIRVEIKEHARRQDEDAFMMLLAA